MFTTDAMIDTFQSSKKNFVNTVFAQNKTVADALNSFVDAQTAYTKSAVKAGTDVAATLGKETVKAVTEASKVDFTKVAETFTKNFSFKK